MTRRYPIGAEVSPDGVHFRVWAPRCKTVDVILGSEQAHPLQRDASGYFSGFITGAKAGDLYRFRLDSEGQFPDPASRFQPQGPHGPSEVVDPAGFEWTDANWQGAALEGQVIYEMHVGTFTAKGTWEAARRELPELAAVGITVVEVMPVADFPGRFGWGYDGVGWFAPVAIYGSPDDFRRFVDEAHRVGIGVILDVVYNHIGPDGNYLHQYSDDYFSHRYDNEWGEALNYDGENSSALRELVTTNTAYWAEEYHLDGLRLDATQQIFDSSPEHIIIALTKSMRAAAGHRKVFLVAENESQLPMLARPEERGGYGLDGLWNDDYHHSARVAVTGHREAYYTDYIGKPQELISAVKYGYLYQGQRYRWQAKRRGAPAWDIEPWQFVTYLDNHDQIANSVRGERLHQLAGPGRLRAITALMLLGPGTPMLFQGQEFAASSPFFFFADHAGELRKLVHEGRIQFLAQFPTMAQPNMRTHFTDPGDLATFERCKLDFAERDRHAPVYQLHKDLLRLRREDGVFGAQRARVEGAVLGDDAFVLRFFGAAAGNDRLLLVNLGADLDLEWAPEPLLAPPEGKLWELAWSSEDPLYGGGGTAQLDGPGNWRLPGRAAVAMRPAEQDHSWQI
jgi:maltooligosyltrehalose trehalohydrolase